MGLGMRKAPDFSRNSRSTGQAAFFFMCVPLCVWGAGAITSNGDFPDRRRPVDGVKIDISVSAGEMEFLIDGRHRGY